MRKSRDGVEIVTIVEKGCEPIIIHDVIKLRSLYAAGALYEQSGHYIAINRRQIILLSLSKE